MDLNKTTWAKLGVSPHGVGVFAIRDIPKGTRITDYTITEVLERKNGEMVMKLEELDDLLPEVKDLILERMVLNKIANKTHIRFIAPNYNQILQCFMNHSDDNNSDGEYALRDIKKGEEITENYKIPFIHELSQEKFKDFLWN